MSFGLEKALGAVQRPLDVLLTKVMWQSALFFLNDIVSLSRAPDEHIDHVRQVLTLLYDARVQLSLKMQSFYKPHQISRSTSFALSACRILHEQLTTYLDSNTRIKYRDVHHFQRCATFLVALFQNSPVLPRWWAKSFVKAHCRPLKYLSTTKYSLKDAKG